MKQIFFAHFKAYNELWESCNRYMNSLICKFTMHSEKGFLKCSTLKIHFSAALHAKVWTVSTKQMYEKPQI